MADTPTLVASSCQKAGSTTLTSARCSTVGLIDHDGGLVSLFGWIPDAASAVQTSGTRTTRSATARKIDRAASRGRRTSRPVLTARGPGTAAGTQDPRVGRLHR